MLPSSNNNDNEQNDSSGSTTSTCAVDFPPMMIISLLVTLLVICVVVGGTVLVLFSETAKKFIPRHWVHFLQVKLDHHLLGKPDTGHSSPAALSASSLSSPISGGLLQQQQPCYFPVLNDSLVATTLRSEEKTSVALETIIREQLEQKLQNTLSGFFQPLITGYRQGT